MQSAWFVLAIVFVALAFDFINGFHDANSIATVVSTRVLSPRFAVAWAAFFNFIAAFVFTTAVAKTISKGVVDPDVVDSMVILGALLGAIAWNLITWYGSIPSSSSHALMGGLAGAAIAKAGLAALVWPGKWVATIAFIFLAPLLGLAFALALTVALSWALRRALPRRVDKAFRVLQLGSAAAFSLGHGGNDAQKTMGVIVGLLVAEQDKFVDFPIRALHLTSHDVPLLVILAAHAAIALGTMAGGWRIVKTMGQRITKLRRVRRLLRRDEWRRLAVHRHLRRHPGQHHAHNNRRHHGRRGGTAPVGRAMGHCQADPVGLDLDDSRLGGNRRPDVRGAAPARLGRIALVAEDPLEAPLRLPQSLLEVL